MYLTEVQKIRNVSALQKALIRITNETIKLFPVMDLVKIPKPFGVNVIKTVNDYGVQFYFFVSQNRFQSFDKKGELIHDGCYIVEGTNLIIYYSDNSFACNSKFHLSNFKIIK